MQRPPTSATPRPVTPSLHGFLLIDKPAGWTSHDVVARVRRLLGERRVGHAGTLDPAATGLLPLAVGSATRVLEFLADATKTYLAEVTFGVATDSHDLDGRVTASRDGSHLSATAIEAHLNKFRGDIDQIPPMHAAIKVAGRRLYEFAHRGEEIAREPRRVTIMTLDLIRWEPPVATLLIDCSKGTYVRALARDLGEAVGPGAYLSDLVRVRVGPFTLCDAVTLADLAEADLQAVWPALAIHPDAVIETWPALLLDAVAAVHWQRGIPIPAPTGAVGSCRAYDGEGNWLGVGEAVARGDGWRPLKVIESTA
jgi:tRNA pseudouridine55 synthase